MRSAHAQDILLQPNFFLVSQSALGSCLKHTFATNFCVLTVKMRSEAFRYICSGKIIFLLSPRTRHLACSNTQCKRYVSWIIPNKYIKMPLNALRLTFFFLVILHAKMTCPDALRMSWAKYFSRTNISKRVSTHFGWHFFFLFVLHAKMTCSDALRMSEGKLIYPSKYIKTPLSALWLFFFFFDVCGCKSVFWSELGDGGGGFSNVATDAFLNFSFSETCSAESNMSGNVESGKCFFFRKNKKNNKKKIFFFSNKKKKIL